MGGLTLPDAFEGPPLPVTPAMIRAYAEFTADFNPIHLDEAFAAASPFGQPIAHGTLGLALALQAATSALGGAAMIGADTQIRFVKPVFPGDVLIAEGRRRPTSSTWDITVRSQREGTVIQGTIEIGSEL